MVRWYFVYVLRSDKDKNLYTGYTNDIKKRVKEHNEGKVTSTKNRVPLRLIYFEASLNKYDAIHREKYSPREITDYTQNNFLKLNNIIICTPYR